VIFSTVPGKGGLRVKGPPEAQEGVACVEIGEKRYTSKCSERPEGRDTGSCCQWSGVGNQGWNRRLPPKTIAKNFKQKRSAAKGKYGNSMTET